jgi:hypothetical protein
MHTWSATTHWEGTWLPGESAQSTGMSINNSRQQHALKDTGMWLRAAYFLSHQPPQRLRPLTARAEALPTHVAVWVVMGSAPLMTARSMAAEVSCWAHIVPRRISLRDLMDV